MEQLQQTDLSNCEKEPIHIPGHIQSHGFLFSLSPENFTINYVSDNIEGFTGKKPGALLGQTIHELVEIIKPVSGTTLNEFLKLGKLTGNFEQLNPQKILVGEREMFLICHIHNGNLICECEPGQTTDDNITLQKIMSTALAVIQSSATFSKLLSRVASLVKEITGYDTSRSIDFNPIVEVSMNS